MNKIVIIVILSALFLTGLGIYTAVYPNVQKQRKNIDRFSDFQKYSNEYDPSYGSLIETDVYPAQNGLVYPYDRFFKEYPNNPWNLYKPEHRYREHMSSKVSHRNNARHR